MAEEVYYPPEIKDQAVGDIPSSGSDNTGVTYNTESYKPLTDVDQKFPEKVIAAELLSTTLDSRAKKIKGEYTFSKEGAIKVGEFVQGQSGEIAISPDGITATNVNGEVTVAIDGTTGDAAFKGEVKGGSFVSEGNVTILGTGGFVINDGQYDVAKLGYFED